MAISPSRVREIETKALYKLRLSKRLFCLAGFSGGRWSSADYNRVHLRSIQQLATPAPDGMEHRNNTPATFAIVDGPAASRRVYSRLGRVTHEQLGECFMYEIDGQRYIEPDVNCFLMLTPQPRDQRDTTKQGVVNDGRNGSGTRR